MAAEIPDAAFGVLGPLEVRVAGAPVTIGGARQQTLLAALLLEAGRVVSTERLTTAIWDDGPPATARVQVQICVSKLRSRLHGSGLAGAIVTRPAGYVILLPNEAVDLHRFRNLVSRGRAAARRDDPAGGAETLRAALRLWRGEPLAGVRSRLVRAAAMRLGEERLAATEEYVELELALGRYRDVIGELRELLVHHPVRERLYGQLMRALYRDGRQAEALEVYREAHRALVDEHGLDPSDELRALERAILDRDPAVGSPAVATLVASPRVPPEAVPRQLPTPPRGFVGRDETVAELREILSTDGAGHAPLVVVTGPPGVGKTALALHTAYQVADRFPDGHLYAYLRGSDARPVPPERVLDQFVRALGVPVATLPSDRDALAAIYRSRLANACVLVVLDDATSARQVEPLLATGPGCAVVVTSRGVLPGLPGAHRFDLGSLSPQASRQLLVAVLGEARVCAEPAEAEVLAEACGHLPLALRVAAAKLEVHPHWPIARLASRLADEGRLLNELSLDGAGVRASLTVSLEMLDLPARRLLALLGALGPTDFAVWVASPLLDRDVDEAADAMDELVDARLVEVLAGTGHRARYHLHDLVGAFAREVLAEEVPAVARAQAVHRLLRCWLFLAREAHRREYGGDFTVLRSGAEAWPLPAPVGGELLADPMRWLESERANLLAAVRLAAELGHHDLCWDLVVTLVTLFENRAYRDDWRETHEIALEAVRRSGDSRAEAAVRRSRAGLALSEHRLTEALPDLRAALDYFERAGDTHGRGLALRGLAFVDRAQGRTAEALARYQQALADFRAVGDLAAEAHVLTSLGHFHTEQGRHDDAEAELRRALAISTGIGKRRGEAQTRYRLGELYLARGQVDLAEAEFTTVWRMVTLVGDVVGEAYALLGVGWIAMARGELERARRILTAALEKARRSGGRLNEAQVLLALAEVSMWSGDGPGAGRRLDQAEELFTAIAATVWRERVAEIRRRSLRAA